MAEVASAYVSLLPSAKGFGSKLDGEIGPQVNSSGKKSGLSFGKLFAAGAALGIGAKAFSFLGDSLAEARDAQVIGARTENVIKKMGGAAGVTAKQVGDLAAAISNKTGIDDEAIQAGQNLLLTFGNVRNEAGKGNDIFNQTSKLMVDMSAAMGTDAKGSAIQLGKALNDPVKGITALSRVGVSFTESQKEMIKGFVESGDSMKAQKVILGELDRQFGGAAAAMTTPAEKAKVAWGNFQEELGTRLLPIVDRVLTAFVDKGLPAITTFAGVVSGMLRPVLADIGQIISTVIVPAVASFITGIQTGEGAGGRFAATIGTISAALGAVATFIENNRAAVGTFVAVIGTAIVISKAWTATQWLLNAALTANPIGIVVVALAALAGGLVYAYKKSDTFRAVVNNAFADVRAAAVLVANFFTVKIPAAFNAVKAAASATLGWVGANWPLILAILTGPFGLAVLAIAKNWDAIKDGAQGVVNFIKTIPSKIIAIFDAMGASMSAAGGKLMGMLAAGVEAGLQKVKDKVLAGLKWIKDKLPGSPIKDGPLKGWNGGKPGRLLMEMLAKGMAIGSKKVQSEMKKTLDRLQNKLDNFKSKLDGLLSDFSALSDSVAGAFNPNVFGLAGKDAITEEIDGIVKVIEPATSALEEFMKASWGNNSNLTAMLAAFDQLKAAGASTGFLNGLFQSGNVALATQLATAGPAAVQEASALFDANANLAAQLGSKVATNELGPKIDDVRAEIKELRKDIRELVPQIAKDVVAGGNATARRGNR